MKFVDSSFRKGKKMQDASSTKCAWCFRESGEAFLDSDSHGICQNHSDQMLIEFFQKKFLSTPSYFERFKIQKEKGK